MHTTHLPTPTSRGSTHHQPATATHNATLRIWDLQRVRRPPPTRSLQGVERVRLDPSAFPPWGVSMAFVRAAEGEGGVRAATFPSWDGWAMCGCHQPPTLISRARRPRARNLPRCHIPHDRLDPPIQMRAPNKPNPVREARPERSQSARARRHGELETRRRLSRTGSEHDGAWPGRARGARTRDPSGREVPRRVARTGSMSEGALHESAL